MNQPEKYSKQYYQELGQEGGKKSQQWFNSLSLERQEQIKQARKAGLTRWHEQRKAGKERALDNGTIEGVNI